MYCDVFVLSSITVLSRVLILHAQSGMEYAGTSEHGVHTSPVIMRHTSACLAHFPASVTCSLAKGLYPPRDGASCELDHREATERLKSLLQFIRRLLYLPNDLLRTSQTLDHLLTFLSSPNCVV